MHALVGTTASTITEKFPADNVVPLPAHRITQLHAVKGVSFIVVVLTYVKQRMEPNCRYIVMNSSTAMFLRPQNFRSCVR